MHEGSEERWARDDDGGEKLCVLLSAVAWLWSMCLMSCTYDLGVRWHLMKFITCLLLDDCGLRWVTS